MGDTNAAKKAKPPLPVDRGWAWCILIGAYVVVLGANSFGRSLSVFLPDILERYNKPAAVTTLAFGVGDISWSITNIAIPALLLPRFSVRTLALWGAFLHCFGVICLAYSPNIIVFNCLFSVFGVAGGLMIVTSQIHLGHYFKKRLSLASSVAQIGASTAMVLVPRLAQFLKDTYGYQGALLILGGISFHCVAAAMLLWPVSMFDQTDRSKEALLTSSRNPLLKLGDTDPLQMAIIVKVEEQEQEDEINEKTKFVHISDFETNQINDFNSTSDFKTMSYNDIIKEQLQAEGKEDVKHIELIPLPETSLERATSCGIHEELQTLSSSHADLVLDSQFSNKKHTQNQLGRSILNARGDRIPVLSDANQDSDRQCIIPDLKDLNVHMLSKEDDVSPQTALIEDGSHHHEDITFSGTSGRCCCCPKMASSSSCILLNPVAVMLVLAGGLSTAGGNMYLPVLGLENGLSHDEVPWMLTIIGIADVFGKLGIGYFADLGYVRPIHIACLTQFTVGMVCQFTNFYKGFGPMAGMAIIFGMMNGVVQSLLPAMIIEMLGLPYLAQVISIFYLAIGLFTFVLNVSVGAIKDATGSFYLGFNFLGGMMLTCVAILILEPVFVRCRDKSSKHKKNS